MNNKAMMIALDELVRAIPIILALGVFLYFVMPHITDFTNSPEKTDITTLANTFDSLAPKDARTLPQASFETACRKSPCEPPKIILYTIGTGPGKCGNNACICITTTKEQQCAPLNARACLPTLAGCSRSSCIEKQQEAVLLPGQTIVLARACTGQLSISTIPVKTSIS